MDQWQMDFMLMVSAVLLHFMTEGNDYSLFFWTILAC